MIKLTESEQYMEHARQRIFVCCPFDMMMDGMLDKLEQAEINPEIGLGGTVYETFRTQDYLDAAKRLESAGLRATIHAPFTDLVIGASDSGIRELSINRIKYAIDTAAIFGARSVVFHSGYDPRHHSEHRDRFLEHATESIRSLLHHLRGSDIKLMLENVYEPDPWLHRSIFTNIEDSRLGFCLDPGHAVVFSSTSPLEWLEGAGQWLGHMHLHDNNGKLDDHLPPGMGIIDFDSIFDWMDANGKEPVITTEPHKEEYVYPALEAIGKMLTKTDTQKQ